MSSSIIKKSILALVLTTVAFLMLIFYYSANLFGNTPSSNLDEITSNVQLDNNSQVITIGSGGGFKPNFTVAKAGIKTTIKFTGEGQIDCSNTVDFKNSDIPSLTIPVTGSKEISIDKQSKGSVINAACNMNMYAFSIKFI